MPTPPPLLSLFARATALGAACTLALAGAACCGAGGVSSGGVAIGDTAPELRIPDLHDSGELTLADRRGQVVLLNFWASWCGPCRMEMPELETLSSRYGDEGLAVLGVSVDSTARDARAFLDENPVSFAVGWDDSGAASRDFRVEVLPRTLLLDREGRVRARYDGFDRSSMDAIEREIEALLEEQP